MDDTKTRVKRAIEAYSKKQLPKSGGTKRKNSKPEKTVEQECLYWMRSQQWDVQIFEAKATYDPRRQIYRQQSMKAGTLDCGASIPPNGISAWIEFKAPGKLSTLRDSQRDFMLKKIETGCFTCVTDSAHRLRTIFMQWRIYIESGQTIAAKKYLKDMMPEKPKQKPGERMPWE